MDASDRDPPIGDDHEAIGRALPQSDVIQIRIARVFMDQQGIIRCVFDASDSHTLRDAQELIAAHDSLSGGLKRPVLGDIRGTRTGASKAAREYYVSEVAATYKSALAMLTKSALQRVLGNLFLSMNSPPYPSRLFTDEDEAIAWLQGFLPPESSLD